MNSGLSRFRNIGCIVAFAAAIAGAASGFGYRGGWLGLHAAFGILRWSAYGGLISTGTLIWNLLLSRRFTTLSAIGLLAGITVAAIPARWMRQARRVPAIHDLSTDTDDPPAFSAVLPLRRTAPNPPEYGGPEIARMQREAYPDLAPAVIHLPPTEVFRAALAAAKSFKWQIVDTNESMGRIEATATTFWFGFKDDIVIRIRPEMTGSRVDVRSVSRVGKGDVGVNARRIRKFLDRISLKE